MLHPSSTMSHSLGADLRALRRVRGLKLADVAVALGKSVGWISQVERDLSTPSITDLRQISALLGVPMSLLFGQARTPDHEVGHIVRKGARRPIGSPQAGQIEELLSPDLTDDFEMVHCTFEPGAGITEPLQRPTQEVGFVVSGQFDLWLDETLHHLNPGDSFRIRGTPFRWANPHATPAVVVWVIAPPVY